MTEAFHNSIISKVMNKTSSKIKFFYCEHPLGPPLKGPSRYLLQCLLLAKKAINNNSAASTFADTFILININALHLIIS